MKKKKNVLVLAGTKWQIPLIKRLRKDNMNVFNINLYEDSPAFAYANHSDVIDILDKEKVVAYARENQIQAIMSDQCDIAVPTIAYVAEQNNLCGIGIENAILFTNKGKMREFCMNHNIPTPEFRVCSTLAEAEEFFLSLGKRMIIKPLNSNSSHGVFTITNENELVSHFEESRQFSIGTETVICERYIEGPEFTVDGVVLENGHISLAVSEKKHYKHNKNVAYELFFSYEGDGYDYNKLRRINDQLVDSTSLPFGLTHAEYKYEDGVFYLIEIGARGGGNLISSSIVPIISGFDNYDYLIRKSIGETYSTSLTYNSLPKDSYAVLEFFDFELEGIVSDIKGTDILETDKRILEYHFNFSKGDVIKMATDDAHRSGYFIACDKSSTSLKQLIMEVKEQVTICVE